MLVASDVRMWLPLSDSMIGDEGPERSRGGDARIYMHQSGEMPVQRSWVRGEVYDMMVHLGLVKVLVEVVRVCEDDK